MISLFKNRTHAGSLQLEDLSGGNKYEALARHIVLNEINDLDGGMMGYSSPKHVRAVIIGDDDLSIHIARQIALISHYPNFNDESGNNRTIITIISTNALGMADLENTKNRIANITGNLLSECLWKCISLGEVKETMTSKTERSFIDVEFEFVGHDNKDTTYVINDYIVPDPNEIVSIIAGSNTLTEQERKILEPRYHQCKIIDAGRLEREDIELKVDVRRAKMVNMIYYSGGHLDDIYLSDIFRVAAYKMALESYCRHSLTKAIESAWDNVTDRKLKLSNVFSADCLECKIRCMNADGINAGHLNGKMMEAYSNSEHARWNVAMLILGYRSYTHDERYKDECLYPDSDGLKEYRVSMKRKHYAHIDICSFNDLMRIDYGNLKYDCLLVLAADYIVNYR